MRGFGLSTAAGRQSAHLLGLAGLAVELTLAWSVELTRQPLENIEQTLSCESQQRANPDIPADWFNRKECMSFAPVQVLTADVPFLELCRIPSPGSLG